MSEMPKMRIHREYRTVHHTQPEFNHGPGCPCESCRAKNNDTGSWVLMAFVAFLVALVGLVAIAKFGG